MSQFCGFCHVPVNDPYITKEHAAEHGIVNVCSADAVEPFIYPIDDGEVCLRVWVCASHGKKLKRMFDAR
jgi:hypothetical protein